MKIEASSKDIGSFKADAVVVGMFENELSEPGIEADKLLNRGLSKVIKEDSFKGKLGKVKIIRTGGMVPPNKIIIAGLGKKDEMTLEKLRRAAGKSAQEARCDGCKSIGTTLHLVNMDASKEARAQAVTEGISLGLYRFDKFKTQDKEDRQELDSATLLGGGKEVEHGVKIGNAVSDSTNYARDLVNMPAAIVTPTYLANEAQKIAKKYNLKVTVIGKEEMRKKGLNAILAVSSGSDQPPKFIILEKKGKGKPAAIVGKGITFDSGGIDIKPAQYMYDMKLDMAGGAAVLGTMKAVCELGLPLSLIGAIPTAENMTGGSAQKPGDIIESYSKKTIEMLHTDAEGRLLLADALAYVEKHYQPTHIIDIATLTGSVMMALGYSAAGLFGTDDELKKRIKAASAASGDEVWEMPIYEQFEKWVESDNADVRNISKAPKGYEAGAGTAAAFLKNFVEGKWAHLDIAGTAFLAEKSDYLCKEATGFGVRLFTKLFQDWD